jgi:hypothetical protein
MIIKCQQQCIMKIRDGVPGHGPQEVLGRYKRSTSGERVALACGCSLPTSWLPKTERNAVLGLPCVIPRRLA